MARAMVLGCLLTTACYCGPPEPAWRELFDGRTLDGFVATQFGGEGEVAVRRGAIELGIGSPLTGITWTGVPPCGDYELEVVATRVQGGDFFCGLTFPVGERHLTLVLGGWGGTVCGLSSLDGLDAAHNATRTLRRFDIGRAYTIHIAVAPETIVVQLDGAPFLTASLRGQALSLRPEVDLCRPLGLASFATAAAIHAVRWRPR